MQAEAGAAITYELPAGCVLRRSYNLEQWEVVETESPFTHAGADAHYRIDCDEYTGPVTATLTITKE